MVKRSEDEIPLTHQSPSITQETKAKFELLLNAALKNEISKDSVSAIFNNFFT